TALAVVSKDVQIARAIRSDDVDVAVAVEVGIDGALAERGRLELAPVDGCEAELAVVSIDLVPLILRIVRPEIAGHRDDVEIAVTIEIERERRARRKGARAKGGGGRVLEKSLAVVSE